MASFEMNQDMIMEILSYLPTSVVQKFRALNQESNKRTYDSSFLKLNLQRTNSVSGYFLQYHEKRAVRVRFVGNTQIPVDFLPQGRIKIEACDASHGILLCVNGTPAIGREPEYIVCKPTTKEYMLIPSPKAPDLTIAIGLMVIGSNPLRYKILRLSKLPIEEPRADDNFNPTFACEVFDSDEFAWKRLPNVELPEEDLSILSNSKLVASYGFLHLLTACNNYVFRFNFETDTWSLFHVPESLAGDRLKLATYEGKLGVVSSKSKKGVDYQELWVLKSSFGNSWVKVKEIKNVGLETVGFISNDIVTLADVDRLCLYNMNNEETQTLQMRAPNFYPSHYSSMTYFSLSSDFEKVEFKLRSNNWISDDKVEAGKAFWIVRMLVFVFHYLRSMYACYFGKEISDGSE